MSFSDWTLFIVKLLSGTGVFLVGVTLLTKNIEQLATNGIKNLFQKTANKKLLNAGIGMASTALIQSSGVTTVLIVGFVNVGLMSLTQATAMIMGANIGTTITAQIAALSEFDFTVYVQVLACVGIMTAMVASKEKVKNAGYIIAGLGIIFIGLSLMSHSMTDYKAAIQSVLGGLTNNLVLFLVGIILTALVQSSSATTSIVIAMSVAGLTIGTGRNEILFFILGTNIGSCVTAIMSTIGASTNAKRAGLIHLMFNVFGSVIFYIILSVFPSFMDVTFKRWFYVPATQIAMFHTFFNLSCAIVFLPFTEVFVKIAKFIIKDKALPKEITYIDERILSNASLAITQLKKESMLLADTAMGAYVAAFDAFDKRDVSDLDAIYSEIEKCEKRSENITGYLIKVSSVCNGSNEEKEVANIHNNVGDIMRIADIADNFTKYAKNEVKHNINFSEGVQDEVRDMVKLTVSLFDSVKECYLSGDVSLLKEVDEKEDKIDAMRKNLINGHIERLNNGSCKPESSGVFINSVSNIERLGDHLTYIAYTVK